MKKHLIALAALAAATSAFAQSSVTLYGNLDVSFGREQSKPFGEKSTTVTNLESGRMTESYFGLRGSEDLGGGLKAVFKLESEIAVDSGAAVGGNSNFFGRNAYVGVAGDFGAVHAGRRESLLKEETTKFNPFGNSGTFAFLSAGNDSWSNSLTYVSPSLGGLTLSAQTSLKEANGTTASTYRSGGNAVSANYTAGGLALSAVFSDVRNTQGAATTVKDSGYLLGASYDFSVVKVFGQYGREKVSIKNVNGDGKQRDYQLGVSVPVGANGAVLASFGAGKLTVDNLEGSSKERQYSLGYSHNLSKRTSAYAAYTRYTEKFGIETDPSEKSSANVLAVGLRHAF